MKVVLPDEEGPATLTMRSRSRAPAIASAICPIRFSWNPSATRMSWVTWPLTHRSLNAPTLVTPSASSQRWCSRIISPSRVAVAAAAGWPLRGSRSPIDSTRPPFSSSGETRKPRSAPVEGRSGPTDRA